MQPDIFKIFKKSIEPVQVMKMPRGTLDIGTATFNETLDAIVKRRNLMAGSIEDSEDFSNNTTVHFRAKDEQYLQVGNYVQIDDEWHSILQIRYGEHFVQGKTKFFRVYLNTDVAKFESDPVWE